MSHHLRGIGVTCFVLVAAGSTAHADAVGRWHFDESPGATIAVDSVGAADGVLVGSATFVTDGVVGNAVHITKSGGGLVDMGPHFPFDEGDFSAVCWVRTTAGDTMPDYVVLGTHHAGFLAGWFIGMNANGPYGQVGKAWFYQSVTAGNEVISSTSVNDGAWHQVVAVYRAETTAQLYIDGLPLDAEGQSFDIDLIDVPFLIGGIDIGGTPTSLFNGWVDEVQLYDHALRPCDVQQLFVDPQSLVDVCPTDLDGDDTTNVIDLLELLGSWGDTGGAADANCDSIVDIIDLLALLAAWGPCP